MNTCLIATTGIDLTYMLNQQFDFSLTLKLKSTQPVHKRAISSIASKQSTESFKSSQAILSSRNPKYVVILKHTCSMRSGSRSAPSFNTPTHASKKRGKKLHVSNLSYPVSVHKSTLKARKSLVLSAECIRPQSTFLNSNTHETK